MFLGITCGIGREKESGGREGTEGKEKGKGKGSTATPERVSVEVLRV